jgi:hypothetical protein
VSKFDRDNRLPFGPVKVPLSFPQLQALGRYLKTPLRCGMCSHKFPPDATSNDHECNPPMFHVEVVEVKPLPQPMGGIFYQEFKLPDLLENPNAEDSRPTEK